MEVGEQVIHITHQAVDGRKQDYLSLYSWCLIPGQAYRWYSTNTTHWILALPVIIIFTAVEQAAWHAVSSHFLKTHLQAYSSPQELGQTTTNRDVWKIRQVSLSTSEIPLNIQTSGPCVTFWGKRNCSSPQHFIFQSFIKNSKGMIRTSGQTAGNHEGSSVGKESICNEGDPSSIPGLVSSPGEAIVYPLQYSWASLVAQMVKNPPAVWDTWVWSLGWEDPLEEGTATCSSILA